MAITFVMCALVTGTMVITLAVLMEHGEDLTNIEAEYLNWNDRHLIGCIKGNMCNLYMNESISRMFCSLPLFGGEQE